MDYNGPTLTLKDLEAGSPEVEQQLFDLLCHKGFAILKLDSSLRELFESLESQVAQFFSSLSIEEKKKVCCEYQTDDKVCRERLELRRSFSDAATYPLTACLQRHQFVSGFEVNTSNEAFELLRQYYVGSHLQNVFAALEATGHRICDLILRRLGIDFDAILKQEESLSDHGQKSLSASILRLLRYPSRIGDDPSFIEPNELAQDHTDLGLVTLMPCSDVPTLQVLDPETYEWISVESNRNRGDLVVVVGEQMSFLTNYAIPAARHRVLQPTQDRGDRISFPFLQRLSPDIELTRNGTEIKKRARQIINHVYSLPMELQASVLRAVKISSVVDQFFASQTKHGKILCSFYYMSLSALPGLSSNDCIVFVMENKPPSRAAFLTLHKALVSQCDVSTKAKYTRIEEWCFDADVSVQAASLEQTDHSVNVVFTTTDFFTAKSFPDHPGSIVKEQILAATWALFPLQNRQTLAQLMDSPAENKT